MGIKKSTSSTGLPIYLDYMSTTPVDPRVIQKMTHFLGFDGVFGNPSSLSHSFGIEASQAVESARFQVASAIGADMDAIIFTSGATESNNLAIIGAARFYMRKGRHLITMSTEHRAVLDSFSQLEREGFEVTYLKPEPDGGLDLDKLMAAIRPDTILVSIMQVNNETGVIQDIAAIGEKIKNKGIVFHVDAAQSAGKIPIHVKDLPVDLMSFSAHKMYGPKGVGALYICQKPRIRLQALTFGGGQERGLRAGTLPTHQIVGLGEAFAIAVQNLESEQAAILHLRKRLWNGIKQVTGIRLNGDPEKRIAGNLNVSFAGIQPDSLLLALKDLAVSRTSACATLSSSPSYVLKALGLSDDLAFSSVRLTVGRYTSLEDVDRAIAIICSELKRLQDMMP